MGRSAHFAVGWAYTLARRARTPDPQSTLRQRQPVGRRARRRGPQPGDPRAPLPRRRGSGGDRPVCRGRRARDGRRRRLARARGRRARWSGASRFVCVPFGTRNHFARDLGLERDDPIAALAAFEGTHGGSTWAGQRAGVPEQRLARDVRAAGARARGAPAATRDARACPRTPDRLRHLSTRGCPSTASRSSVCSSSPTTPTSSTCSRSASESGLSTKDCCTCTPAEGSRRELDGAQRERFTVDARAGSLRAAIDGEPARLKTPLEFEIEPAALRVLVPPA